MKPMTGADISEAGRHSPGHVMHQLYAADPSMLVWQLMVNRFQWGTLRLTRARLAWALAAIVGAGDGMVRWRISSRPKSGWTTVNSDSSDCNTSTGREVVANLVKVAPVLSRWGGME